MKIEELAKLMKPCPSCGCEDMGIVYSQKWAYKLYHGRHEGICIIANGNFGSWGNPEMLLQDWNKRVFKNVTITGDVIKKLNSIGIKDVNDLLASLHLLGIDIRVSFERKKES